MSNLYTLAVYVRDDTGTRLELLDADLRLPFNWADAKAAELNQRYALSGRTYKAINVNDLEAYGL